MLIAINRCVRRQRRRLMTVAAVVALCGAVVAAHSVTAGDHMGDGTVMCLAVLEVAALAAVGVGACAALVTLLVTSRWLVPMLPALSVPASPPEPRARATPAVLQVFRL